MRAFLILLIVIYLNSCNKDYREEIDEFTYENINEIMVIAFSDTVRFISGSYFVSNEKKSDYESDIKEIIQYIKSPNFYENIYSFNDFPNEHILDTININLGVIFYIERSKSLSISLEYFPKISIRKPHFSLDRHSSFMPSKYFSDNKLNHLIINFANKVTSNIRKQNIMELIPNNLRLKYENKKTDR